MGEQETIANFIFPQEEKQGSSDTEMAAKDVESLTKSLKNAGWTSAGVDQFSKGRKSSVCTVNNGKLSSVVTARSSVGKSQTTKSSASSTTKTLDADQVSRAAPLRCVLV